MESIGDGFKKIGELDVAIKIGAMFAGTAACFSAIALPTSQQKDTAAMALFSRPMEKLTPQEKTAAGEHHDSNDKSIPL